MSRDRHDFSFSTFHQHDGTASLTCSVSRPVRTPFVPARRRSAAQRILFSVLLFTLAWMMLLVAGADRADAFQPHPIRQETAFCFRSASRSILVTGNA